MRCDTGDGDIRSEMRAANAAWLTTRCNQLIIRARRKRSAIVNSLSVNRQGSNDPVTIACSGLNIVIDMPVACSVPGTRLKKVLARIELSIPHH